MAYEVPERYNVSTILDRNLEQGRGSKPAVLWQDASLTYQELFQQTCAFANALRDLGVQREQRLLLVLDDSPAFPIVFLGAIRAGAVPVPVNPLYRPDDFAFFLQDSYARAAIVDHPFLPKFQQAVHSFRQPPLLIIANGPAPEGALTLEQLLQAHQGECPPADTHRDDMAFWLYSSGSTGRPKGVVHLQRNIPYTCETYALQVLGIREDDVTFSTSKLFHAYGLGNNLTFPYWVGATTVLRSGPPTPDGVLETIQRFRPTLFFSVPTLYNAILNSPEAGKYDLSSVRLCVSAAEPLPPQVFHRWKDTFGLTILDGIGSTEMLHIFCSNRPEEVRPGSSGRPVPGYELRLLSPEGEPVSVGEAGDLYVKGGSAFAYYWHHTEKTRATFQGEWVRTGDRYRMDEEGFYWYEGRADDMIKVSGLWVSPIEIENTLMEHPAVLEAAVVGIQVEGFTRIKAFVVLKEGTTSSDALVEELQEWCKSRLQRYQYPHMVEFVQDLPKTVTGKVQRYKLRQQEGR
ncbi:MAG TPA: benzoate-CoA ligase family protein [Dehalococcoidia bacterium]|nr:benzoate-CoA ligase family protein [Dehalococcoidia bacterium]